MSQLQGKKILKGRFSYLLSKIAPKNSNITINLKNGLKFILRARTMDKSVLKEVWFKTIYDKHNIKVEKGDTVIDIGAHIGIFSIYASEISQTGNIYAFEPFIENYKRLEKHKIINNKNNLFIYNEGITDKEGIQTLYLSPDNNTGGHSLYLKSHSNKKVDIHTIKLMDFCEREKINRIDFLKMDCEGAEFDILMSNETVLKKVNKIIMECHPYKDNNVAIMIQLLERNGFKVIRESNNSTSGVEMLYARKII